MTGPQHGGAPAGADLPRLRWPEVAPSAVIGTLCVVAGGMVAAVTAPVASEESSWAAAYLVLVGGVAQIALGVGSATLSPRTSSSRTRLAAVALWNFGNAAVLAGVLAGRTAVVDAGGAGLVVALLLTSRSVRHSIGPRPLTIGYWTPLALLAVSIPTGLVLTRVRGG